MRPRRASFQPVTSDIDDDKLERLAEEKGVGSMVKTVTSQGRGGQGAAAQAELSISRAWRPPHDASSRARASR